MALVLFFTAVFTLFGSMMCQSDPSICPDREYISPCTCSKTCEKCEASITCSNILNLDQLNAVFKKSKDYSFFNFAIVNSSFLYIPSKAFAEKRVRRLYLRNNAMLSLFDKPPPASNELKKIEISNLVLRRGVKWNDFSSFPHLDEFNLTALDLKKIDRSFIDHFPRGLTELYFSKTETKKLGDNVFSQLSELVALFVKNTKIETLNRSMFPTHSKLTAIDFSGNLISSLPADIFSNMPDLLAIELSHTRIITLPKSVFGRIMPGLNVLSMKGNHMVCDCQMKWITKLSKLPLYLDMVCAYPRALNKVPVKNLKPTHFKHCE